MFAEMTPLPPDPILGLSKLYAEDSRAEKIDLGVGVFRNLEGVTPVMKAVAEAQTLAAQKETTKVYTAADGAAGFTEGVMKLVFGENSPVLRDGRCAAVQAPGGCGALRLAGELLNSAGAKRITIGEPTWPNHTPLLSAAGNDINLIPYYNTTECAIEFDRFIDGVKTLGPEDVLLLHGACHNPTGADLTHEQIDQLIDLAEKQGFVPLIDTAYHGLAVDLETDAYIIRAMAARLPEVLVTYSCSKNFGLYRERTGALLIIAPDSDRAAAVKTHALKLARANYSMPPAQGGVIVSEILHSDALTAMWRDELAEMTAIVRANRKLLVETAGAMGLGNRLSYIETQNGMFSMLPTTKEDVIAMREKYGVYAVGAGRINLCGVNANNVEHLVTAIRDVLTA